MAGKNHRSGVVGACGLAVAAALMNGGSAKAATLFSTGFEVSNVAPANFTSTGYTQGAFLTGQPGSPPAFTSAVTSDVTSGSGSAVVAAYTGTGFTGTASNAQYVQLNDLSGITSTTYASYFPALSGISPVAAGTPVVDVVGTIGVSGGTGSAAFGLVAYDGTGAQNQIADLLVDAATGVVTYSNGTGTTSFTAATSPVTFNSYELQLNYSSGTYSIYQAAAGATSFTNLIASSIPFETAATTFSSGGIFSETDTAAAGSGLGLFDNLAISTNAVPEPASASLLVGGLLLAGGRRRRSAR